MRSGGGPCHPARTKSPPIALTCRSQPSCRSTSSSTGYSYLIKHGSPVDPFSQWRHRPRRMRHGPSHDTTWMRGSMHGVRWYAGVTSGPTTSLIDPIPTLEISIQETRSEPSLSFRPRTAPHRTAPSHLGPDLSSCIVSWPG